MRTDYTINDAFKDGFECGLSYILRYVTETYSQSFNDDEIARLADHLESKKPWKSNEEWENLIWVDLNRNNFREVN